MRPMWRALVAMLLLGGTIIVLPMALNQTSLSDPSPTAALAASNPRGDNGSGDDKNNQPGYDASTGTMTDNPEADTSNDNGVANTDNDNGAANTDNDNTTANTDNDNVSAGAPAPPPPPPSGDEGGHNVPNQP
jgi:hypothetical protein